MAIIAMTVQSALAIGLLEISIPSAPETASTAKTKNRNGSSMREGARGVGVAEDTGPVGLGARCVPHLGERMGEERAEGSVRRAEGT